MAAHRSAPTPGPEHVTQIAERRAAMTELLVQLAEIGSGSFDPAGLDLMRHALRRELSELPCEVDDVPVGRATPVLCARARPDAPVQVLLSGHIDTVYGPDDPFQQVTWRDPDTLQGPGVLDMKGGIVVMLEALRAVEQSPWAGGIGWRVVLVPDEEIGSLSSRGVLTEAAAKCHAGMVFEPGLPNGDVVRNRLGSGAVTMTARGRAAHSGRDFASGRNALVALADAATAAHALNTQIEGVIVNVAQMTGGTAVNVVPDSGRLQIGVRAESSAAADLLLARLHRAATEVATRSEVEIAVEGGFQRPPRRVDERWDRLFSGYREAARDLGMAVGFSDAGGSSDGNLLTAAGLPALDGLGPLGAGMHSPEEHVLLPTLVDRARVAALVLMRMASRDIATA